MLLASFLILTPAAHSQTTLTVSGNVLDTSRGQALQGASIVLQGKTVGTITDQNGHFQLQVPIVDDTAILSISHVGYETQNIRVTETSGDWEIVMKESHIIAGEFVVSASRISETILEAPVSILKMNSLAVTETPSENFYAALPGLKGIDVLTNSLLYKTINTRGFNNNANFRIVQLIDGIDNSLVGLGWPIGNVLGVTDLDVEKVELIPGPASALYGANAFNGLVNISTKDPFRYQGLSVLVKNGFNHLATDARDPAWYTDLQLRYAKAISKRFAFKVNMGYTKGDDWLLTDSSDIYAFVPDELRGPDNPARDAVNIYGDEVVSKALVTTDAGVPTDVSRTGYQVTDLVDQSTYSFKANTALEYKLNDLLKLSYAFNFASATTSYSSIYSMKNMLMWSHKLELTGPQYFVRGAYLADDLGDTYSINLLAGAINRSWKSNGSWFSSFASAFNGLVDGVTPKDFFAARAYADIGRLIPGTDAFNDTMDRLLAIPFSSGGALVIDHSSKFYLQGEYDFSKHIKLFDFIAGADYKLTRLNSDGTIFIDEPGEPILTNQFAAYAQASKKMAGDHLKLMASLRYDYADNFKGVWAPRFTAVYHPDDQNFFRASFQSGFRLPEPQLQYMDILLSPVPPSRRIGGTAVVDEPYNSRYNSFTQASTKNFTDAVRNYLMNHPGEEQAAIELYDTLLQKSPYDYIQPEKVQTVEAGYRRLFMDERIYVDINYFHNNYSGFIYSTTLVQPDSGNALDPDALYDAAFAVYKGQVKYFTTTVNSLEKVTLDGIEAGASVLLPKGYVLSGNLTWIQSSIEPGMPEPGIRTPPLKSNVSIGNQNFIEHLGFMINWRWTDAISNWSNAPESLSIDNSLPAYNIIDAQVSYRVAASATTIKAGASNLLNFYHQDYAQGISVGGIYYVSLLYDGVFK